MVTTQKATPETAISMLIPLLPAQHHNGYLQLHNLL